jgi:hypothetical protein
MAPWAVRDVPKGIPDPDNADLLSANLLVKQNLCLGIFKTIAPTFPSTTNSPVCVGPNIHGGAEALRVGQLD